MQGPNVLPASHLSRDLRTNPRDVCAACVRLDNGQQLLWQLPAPRGDVERSNLCSDDTLELRCVNFLS